MILGERARPRVAQALMVAFYPIVIGAALVGFIGPWVALVLLGIPRLVEVLRVFAKPKPEAPPHSYVGWPLWFVGAAFIHTRRAGALLILGLLLNAILPITCPGGRALTGAGRGVFAAVKGVRDAREPCNRAAQRSSTAAAIAQAHRPM